MPNDFNLYEIYTLNPITKETGWDIHWVWSTPKEIETYPNFDCIITTNDGGRYAIENATVWEGEE